VELDPELQYLLGDPDAELPAPPVHTAPQLLPFHDLSWENFERFCYRLVRTEAECEQARFFGERGQNQSGIDLYCRDREGFSVYQCRRVAKLTASDIVSAVDDFLKHDWAPKAHRFVLCTSRRAVTTQLADRIEMETVRLNACEPPVAFDVWDAEELSARLKEDQSPLVHDFFGPTWHDAFLPGATATHISTRLAEVSSGLDLIAENFLRIRFITWAPTLLGEAIEHFARDDKINYAKLDDAVGDPPDPASVVNVIGHPPPWLNNSLGVRPWLILGMLAEKDGEWKAAKRAWLAAADVSEGDARAGFLASASVAAEVGGDIAASVELLIAAEALAPNHPRVRLQRVDQNLLGPARLDALQGIESDEPAVAALLALHRAAAYMLVPDMEQAARYVAEAGQLLPDSLSVKATAVNVAIHRARIASNEHTTIDYPALLRAHDEALQVREQLIAARRYTESVRMLMLAVDSMSVAREPVRARRLIRSATDDELMVADAAEVLGDAALRARAWDDALSLTEDVQDSDGSKRIRASAHLEAGNLHKQNQALEILDDLIATRGREASQAALHRLAATFGRRQAEWSEDAFDALLEEGFEAAALAGKAQFLARRRKDFNAAEALLAPHEGSRWADDARLSLSILRDDKNAMRTRADVYLRRGAVQDDRVQCAAALARAGDIERARDILMFTTLDTTTPPATRGDAYALLISLIVREVGDWDAAVRLHGEWVDLRPGDDRASVWAPRIANHRRSK
jgi:hypothetical protein